MTWEDFDLEVEKDFKNAYKELALIREKLKKKLVLNN